MGVRVATGSIAEVRFRDFETGLLLSDTNPVHVHEALPGLTVANWVEDRPR